MLELRILISCLIFLILSCQYLIDELKIIINKIILINLMFKTYVLDKIILKRCNKK